MNFQITVELNSFELVELSLALDEAIKRRTAEREKSKRPAVINQRVDQLRSVRTKLAIRTPVRSPFRPSL